MTQELYERCRDEFETLESQLSPWDDEAHRAFFVEAFNDFLASFDLTWNDFQDAIETRLSASAGKTPTY